MTKLHLFEQAFHQEYPNSRVTIFTSSEVAITESRMMKRTIEINPMGLERYTDAEVASIGKHEALHFLAYDGLYQPTV